MKTENQSGSFTEIQKAAAQAIAEAKDGDLIALEFHCQGDHYQLSVTSSEGEEAPKAPKAAKAPKAPKAPKGK